MSRIGQKTISVPQGVKIDLTPKQVKLTGPLDTLTLDLTTNVAVQYDSKAAEIRVTRTGDQRFDRAMHGTTRAHLANMIQGVTKGFEKTLNIFGTGYSVEVKGSQMVLKVGFGHPVNMPVPNGVKIDIKTPATRGNEIPAEFTVRGASKQAVGQFAAAVRALRPPEPYLGKGIRYKGERIKRKVGKAFGSA